MEQGKFDVLFNQYYERLVLFAESYVGDLETAEDMVQDVFFLFCHGRILMKSNIPVLICIVV